MRWNFAAAISPVLLGVAFAQQPAAPPPADQSNGMAAPIVTATDAANVEKIPAPTFKINTRIVVLDVVATNRNGASVRNLKQDQFHVFENGHEQSFKVFEEHDNEGLPILPAAAVDTGAKGGVTEASNAGQQLHNTALSVILFDAMNTASSDQSFARAQVKKVIASLPPGSRIAVFVLGNSLHLVQGFTVDTSALLAAMNKSNTTLGGPWFNDPDMVLSSSGGDPAVGNRRSGNTASLMAGDASAASNMGPSTYLRDTSQQHVEELTDELRVTRTLTAFSTLVKYLSVLPGKKNLLWLSGNFPLDFSMHALAVQMEAGHIAVYPIDVRGQLVSGTFSAANGGHVDPSSFNEMAAAQLTQTQAMEDIAHQTGGRAIYNDNDIQGEIIESLNQGNNYYTLAYTPSDKNWNGKYRKIEVRSDLKDVTLYYRRGYFADDPAKGGPASSDTMPKFAVAMLHGAPEPADIVLSVKAAPTGEYLTAAERKPPPGNLPFPIHLKGTTEVYDLACTIDAKTISFTRNEAGAYVPRLTFTLLAYDADGKVLNAITGMFVQPLTEAQYQAVLHHGLTVSQKMELPTGRVYLRVGVHDLRKEQVGATELPLTIERR